MKSTDSTHRLSLIIKRYREDAVAFDDKKASPQNFRETAKFSAFEKKTSHEKVFKFDSSKNFKPDIFDMFQGGNFLAGKEKFR